jgi:hypothetical protein
MTKILKTKEMKLYEEDVIDVLLHSICELDTNEMARVVGEVLGGDCHSIGGYIIFTPNENYFGSLDELKDENESEQREGK